MGTFGAATIRVPRARLTTPEGKTAEWRNATIPAYQRRVGEKVAVLVHGAALNRHVGPKRRERLIKAGTAIDNNEFRRLQTARNEIIEQSPPGRFAFPTHVLDRQQYLLAVAAHAKRQEQRDRGCLLVKTHAHDRAIKNKADDRLIGERAGVPGVPVANV
jgi:hypothetical protein